jgi:RNA polymerase sigma factor (sigma-70 family)
MSIGCKNSALRQVARVFQDGTLTGLSDQQMLEQFVDHGDGLAFEVLVTRHGPMVSNVCRQLLHDPHDAEDAFQAVFLVLVRKAASVRIEGSLGPYLHKVATRVAARARAKRRRSEPRTLAAPAQLEAALATDRLERQETAAMIQEELGRLPERLRVPLVLCYLQGMTHELAASQLGCPVGTVSSRLSRGRAQLLARITRRGLTLSATALVVALESNATAAAIPANLRTRLIKTLTHGASKTVAGVGGLGVSVSVATLLEGALNVMRIRKLAIIAAGAFAIGGLGFVVANRAAAVGGTPSQELVPANDSQSPISRTKGPDGRPVGAVFAKPRPGELFTKTYYVGDIVVADQVARRHPSNLPGGAGVQGSVDVKPIVQLITSTIAPGTWRANDDDSQRGEKPNAIVPFYLSISLVVRCKTEVHDQIACLLHGLRDLLAARDLRKNPPPDAGPSESQRKAAENSATPSGKPREADQAGPTSRQRVQQLLDQLQQEIQKLPRNKD